MTHLLRNSLVPTLAALAMSGCYVIPMGPDGQPVYAIPGGPPPQSPSMAPMMSMPTTLTARLYPINEIASQTGMLNGTITATPGGKGHFQLVYRGDMMTGEATRVSTDERRGIASAYGPGGLSMSCEYQMMHPRQGAGTCTFSTGAKYQVHIGG